jgi:undecaprenyl-diphosphatase
MSIIQSILLGIIQGLTEFIPVSSTAHLLIGQRLLGLEAGSELFTFTVLVQQGTLLALIVYYWTDLWTIGRAWVSDVWFGVLLRRRQPFKELHARLGWYLLLGTIPAALAGVLLKDLVEGLFRTPMVEASIRMLITIGLLLAAESFGRRNRRLDDLNWVDALWVGAAQVLSVFPGASRSGSTIAGGMLRGFDRPSAARFAFLLSVPIMLAAGAYETFDLLRSESVAGSLLPSIIAGIITAAVVGYLAIRWLLAYLARRPLYVFAIYCAFVLLGIAVFLIA